MIQQTTLSKAIAFAIVGSTMAMSSIQTASASTTMYNLFNASDVPRVTDGVPGIGSQTGGTDGWIWGGANVANLCGTPDCADPGWVGTSGGTTSPFNTTKVMPLNWAAHITGLGDSLEISQADAFARYGVYPDLDTAAGTWHQIIPKTGTDNGWRHNIEIGLFKSDATQDVTLKVSGLTYPDGNFGITVYTGLSASETEYSHHGPYYGNDGLAFEGMPHLTHTPRDPVTGLTSNSLTFTATADQIYTIVLGGNNGQAWNGKYDGYKLDINTPPVPLPGAVWLFGSALAGLIGAQRRKQLAA